MEEATQEVADPAIEAEKAQQEAMNAQEAINDARMEGIVVLAREKILPMLKEKDKTIDASKVMLDTLAVTIQQGLFLLMRSTKVEALELRTRINENYPDYQDFIAVLDLVEGETMENAIETLQWMTKKMDEMIRIETKERKFADLKMEF